MGNDTNKRNYVTHRLTLIILCLVLVAIEDMGQSLSVNRPIDIGLFGSADTIHGLQINAFSSSAKSEMYGMQVAAIANLAGHGRGVQVAGFTNSAVTSFRGVQVSGITNIAMGIKRGLQLSVIANICSTRMRGLQIATHNYADTLSGSQVGLINLCVSHPNGVQLGIVNYSRDTVAHKIGLVNVNPKTRIDMVVFGGNSSKVNVGVRFRNRSTYNIIGIGTHYMGLDEKFSGTLYYRIGQYFALSPRWTISGDLGYFHIETFEENSETKPERLYSLQARVNADCRISPTLGAFASLGYGDTRYYYHARHYRTRIIIEAGITININRRSTR